MKPKRRFTNEQESVRLDVFLSSHLPEFSRAFIQEMIKLGRVLVDGARAKPARLLQLGETVELELSRPAPGKGAMESWILHEDKDLLVLNKPSGLLMHPAGISWLKTPEALWTGETSLAGILAESRPALVRSGVPRFGIVHRLDRLTSGVLLVAKTKLAWDRLTDGFRFRMIHKVYRAVVRGKMAGKTIKVDAPVGRNAQHKKITVTPFGKASQTGVSVVARSKGFSLVEARPLTGRTHQIRAHLAYLGHPVAGDSEHGDPQSAPQPPRLMLHAYRIELTHPGTGKPAAFEAPPPADFETFWASCVGRSSKR